LDNERRERARLENELRQRPDGNSNNQPTLLAEALPNVPLVMLEATRDGATNELVLPAGAKNVVLWLEVEPSARFESFRLQIYSADNRLVLTIDRLKKNAYGALAASVPASVFQGDKHLVKLYGMNQQQLLGEYKLQVRKR
jgi:hypothetical protein